MSNKPKGENLLDFVPVKNEKIPFSTDENGKVTLAIENKGLFNKIAQKLFKKPKISYIHLDEMGSFIWPIMDGEKDVFRIGELVKERGRYQCRPRSYILLVNLRLLEAAY